MYTRFQLAKKYLEYYFSAANGKGHGVHSPFVFDMIQNVLNDRSDHPDYTKTERIRKHLLSDERYIDVEDFGAGSAVIKSNKRKVCRIAASSLKSKKYAKLLSRIAKYYKPKQILELGTSFGITTAYLATSGAQVVTLEGAASIAAIAEENFQLLGLDNITVVKGPFNSTLPDVLDKLTVIDLAFIDGNHRKAPTLEYFHALLRRSTADTMLIFDDIHWSIEMEEAWEEIKHHPAVTMTIDLFFIGIVLLRKEFKVKQHFIIRF